MLLPFLADLISRSPADKLVERLVHTAYDELMVVDLNTDHFQSHYHADGKFFAPALDGGFSRLLEYASGHMVHPEDRALHQSLMDPATMLQRLAASEDNGILHGIIRYLALDGNWRQMQHLLVSGPARGLQEGIVYFYLYDVQEMRDREQGQHLGQAEVTERVRMLMPDLHTEPSFFSLAQQRLPSLQGQWCMIAVDIKHFKLFKELNGQEKGDQLLVRFGARIHRVAEVTGGLACYRGQDDYGLLIPFSRSRIDRLFNDLKMEIDQLSSTSGFFPVFGICMIEDTEVTALDQFNMAALTAEEIKDDLRCHVRIYDPETHERHVEEFRLLADFNSAIMKGEILFHLQPQVNVVNGCIVGAESLARWRKTDGSFVSPTVFVPVLEKYGVITNLDMHVWEQVCVYLRALLDQGIDPVPISVNVSRINIFSVDVPAFLSGLMEKYALKPEYIEVEITESAYVDDAERIQSTISELRRRGFRVLMDDFGSGYSSLNMLRNVHVDVIKLDAQFLRFTIGEEQKGISILESIISMTKSLATPMIVEGVETPELVQYLKDMGCRYMQGFYYWRPMLPDQFTDLIRDPARVDHRGIIHLRNKQMHLRELLDENIYSDAMLNNILGAVAFYGWRGDNVDIVRFNSQFVQLIGLDAQVLEERRYHIQNFFHPADRARFFEMLAEARKDRINGSEGLFRIYKPNGTIFWMQLRVYYLRDNEKGEAIFYGSARDMTELQYVNSDLPGSYLRCAVSSDFDLFYVSRAFQQMTGFSADEIRARFQNKFINMIHPDDRQRVIDEFHSVSPGQEMMPIPYRVLHQSGNYLYVMDQSILTDRYGEVCWQSMLIDITDVMILRNQMRLLEQYSTDSIIFFRKGQLRLEVAVYGLENLLGYDQEAFEEGLMDRTIHFFNNKGEDIYPLFDAHVSDPGSLPRLNGLYSVATADGRQAKLHIRFNPTSDKEQETSLIVTLTPASAG